MSHFENAGYRILSFKYSPVVVKKEAPGLEGGDGEVANQNAKSTKPPDTELPSLSSLMTSLQEIEDDSGTDQGKKTAVEVMGSAPEETVLSALRTPTTTAPAPPTEFHLFEDLPTELRLKIWDLTFLPRVVELRSTRPNYSAGHDDGREPQVSRLASDPSPLPSSCDKHPQLTPIPVAIRLQQPSGARRMRRGPRARPRAFPHRLPARRAGDLRT